MNNMPDLFVPSNIPPTDVIVDGTRYIALSGSKTPETNITNLEDPPKAPRKRKQSNPKKSPESTETIVPPAPCNFDEGTLSKKLAGIKGKIEEDKEKMQKKLDSFSKARDTRKRNIALRKQIKEAGLVIEGLGKTQLDEIATIGIEKFYEKNVLNPQVKLIF